MVHGNGQTGVNFLAHRRWPARWVDRFGRRGFAVYVVDQVGRGRSGVNPEVYGPYARLAPGDLEASSLAGEVRPLSAGHAPYSVAGGAGAKATPPSTSSNLSQCLTSPAG